MKLIKTIFSKARIHLSLLEIESIMAFSGIVFGYYNVFLYGYLAAVITSQFFPESSPWVVVLSMTLSYLIGPLGAILCGHVGDSKGRKKILVWTLTLVSIPSFLISILPAYDQIGILATILFVILIAVQTLAFGGDTLGLFTFLLENVPDNRRGLFGGLMSTGSAVGVMFASMILSLLDPLGEELSSWRWRIPLSIGVFGMLVAIYFYRRFGETAAFTHYKKKCYQNTVPVIDLFKYNKLTFLKVLGLTALAPIITVVIFGFIPHFGVVDLGLTFRFTMWSNTISLVVFSILAPCFGTLADRIGRRPILFCVAFLFLSLGFPLFSVLEKASMPTFVCIQVFFAMLSSAYYGVAAATSVGQLPTHIRFTGVGLGYYISYAMYGGINGIFITKLLIKNLSIDFSPVFYLLFGSFILLIASLFIKDIFRKHLPE